MKVILTTISPQIHCFSYFPDNNPFMVGFYTSSESKTPFCGGSIIRSNTVLTAAHCSKLMIPGNFDKIQVTSKDFKGNLKHKLKILLSQAFKYLTW